MTTDSRLLGRVVRRETHSPRTAAMTIAVLVALIALAYVVTELVLALVGAAPLMAGPVDALVAIAEAPASAARTVLALGAIVVALVGLALVVIALTPGRLPKHLLETDAAAVVVADNGVIAAALSQRISDEAGLDPARVRVGVAHRRIDVTVHAEPGVPVRLDAIREIAEREVAQYRLQPAVRTSVRVVHEEGLRR